MRFLLKSFIAIGVILLLAGVIAWKAPAIWLLSRANLSQHDIQYAGASGTMWNGVAKGIKWHDLLLG